MPVTLTHITTDLVLSKFSSRQRKQDGSQGDWVHWTSPTLLVSLAVQATEQNAYHSARLVVIFRREGHPDITLEELDLLSFSSLDLTGTRITPLRAVYSASLVGLKYIHPLSSATAPQPAYNQVQMRFRDVADATSFISELAKFCPCKEDVSNAPATASMRPPATPLRRPGPTLSRMPSRTSVAPFASTSISPTARIAPSPHVSSSPINLSTASRSVAPSFRRATTNSHSMLSTSSAQDVDMDTGGENQLHFEESQSLVMPHSQMDVSSSSIVASTPPGYMSASERITPVSVLASPLASLDVVPAALQQRASETKENILSVLREVPQLYQLTTPDLEQAIGEIVREPGFLEFLGRVETMWRVRGLVGR